MNKIRVKIRVKDPLELVAHELIGTNKLTKSFILAMHLFLSLACFLLYFFLLFLCGEPSPLAPNACRIVGIYLEVGSISSLFTE